MGGGSGTGAVAPGMAALELIGPLMAIVVGAELLQGRLVRVWVDDSGSCNIWRHGYSGSCRISTNVVKAVAAALGCKVDISKIRRCSNSGAEMASKAVLASSGGKGATCWAGLRGEVGAAVVGASASGR